MRRVWAWSGRLLFWVTWPVSYLTIRHSERTRALIVCGDEVLVKKDWHTTGKWSLPGGGLHKREAVVNGLLREVREEVGLALPAASYESLGWYQFTADGLPFNCHLFTAELPNKPDIHLRPLEITDATWLARTHVDAQNCELDVVESLRRLAAKR